MKVALDVMSGDQGLSSNIKGAMEALKEIEKLRLVLVGKKNLIEEELKKHTYDKTRIEIKNSNEIIEMTDDPIKAVREKKMPL